MIPRAEQARIRALGGQAFQLLSYDRSRAGEPEIVECEGCPTGIAERVADDYCTVLGVSYAAVNGSSQNPKDHCWLCADCTAAEDQGAA